MADQVALRIADAEVFQHRQLGLVFHTLGNHARVGAFGHLPDRAHELDLVGVLVNVGDEMLVDLDEGRFQFRPEAQTGKPLPEIVDGHFDPRRVQPGRSLPQIPVIERGRVFGDFDPDLTASQAEMIQFGQQRIRRKACVQQAARRQIHKQPSRQIQPRKGLQRHAYASPVQRR